MTQHPYIQSLNERFAPEGLSFEAGEDTRADGRKCPGVWIFGPGGKRVEFMHTVTPESLEHPIWQVAAEFTIKAVLKGIRRGT